jgi:hypothetical protein
VYSAVTYMRTQSVLGVMLRFVQAKSRLKPIKSAFTIPRMELLAAKMGLALAKKLVTVLNVLHQAIRLWTDSRAVHDWLLLESRALQVFVKKRVLKIRQYLKLTQVLWVPGTMTPAVAATRGITVTKLKEAKEWFNGLEFLTHRVDLWPDQPPEPGRDLVNILPETITGLKKTRHRHINDLLCTVATQVCLFSAAPARDNYADPLLPHLLKFKDWEKLIRIVAYCRRMVSRKKGDISPLEKIEAERALAFHNQRTSF